MLNDVLCKPGANTNECSVCVHLKRVFENGGLQECYTGLISDSYYRPQTKFAKVMFLQVSVILSRGGMRGCSGGCMVAPGGGVCMVAPRGACVVAPGGACLVAPGGACVVALGGMCGCSRGTCMVARGAWLLRGERAWFLWWDTVNERAVRILLECILVCWSEKNIASVVSLIFLFFFYLQNHSNTISMRGVSYRQPGLRLPELYSDYFIKINLNQMGVFNSPTSLLVAHLLHSCNFCRGFDTHLSTLLPPANEVAGR